MFRSTAGVPCSVPSRLFLVLLVAAFLLYVAALLTLRGGGPFRIAATVAVVVQLAPLGAPLLLSTDAWTYWGYGWIGAEGQGNPYVDPPERFPESPAAPYLGASWQDTTTVYGPVFTVASEGVASVAGRSSDRAAWIFKALAAAAAIAAALLAARLARRPALAVAAVGWNPLLAVHLAGGGHNDAWLGAMLLAALALGAAGHVVGRARSGRLRSRSSGSRSCSSRYGCSSAARRDTGWGWGRSRRRSPCWAPWRRGCTGRRGWVPLAPS